MEKSNRKGQRLELEEHAALVEHRRMQSIGIRAFLTITRLSTHQEIDVYCYRAKLKRTEAAIEEYRIQIDTRKAENYGFASMAAVSYAHVVAKMLRNKHPKGTNVELAPNPKDIVSPLYGLPTYAYGFYAHRSGII